MLDPGRYTNTHFRDTNHTPLTDAKLRTLKPATKPYKVSDSEGLHVLVTTTGSVLWRFAYRFEGKQKLLALGSYPFVPLAEARGRRQSAS